MSHCCVDQLGENALCACRPGNVLGLLTSLRKLLEVAVLLILREMFKGAYVLLHDVVGLAVAPLEGAEAACVLGGVESCRSQVERHHWVWMVVAVILTSWIAASTMPCVLLSFSGGKAS